MFWEPSSPKRILPRKWFKSNVWSFKVLSCSAFNAAFVANVANFEFKSEFFTRLEISDMLTNAFYFIFASSTSLVKLLWSEIVKYFSSIVAILTSESVFLTKPLRSAFLLSTYLIFVLRTVIFTKPLTPGNYLSLSRIFFSKFCLSVLYWLISHKAVVSGISLPNLFTFVFSVPKFVF